VTANEAATVEAHPAMIAPHGGETDRDIPRALPRTPGPSRGSPQ
jgi:hypothetical protein